MNYKKVSKEVIRVALKDAEDKHYSRARVEVSHMRPLLEKKYGRTLDGTDLSSKTDSLFRYMKQRKYIEWSGREVTADGKDFVQGTCWERPLVSRCSEIQNPCVTMVL